MEPSELIWMNGDFVAWDDAKVHVLTHGLHYGTGVFEGIRAYETPKGTAIFRHHDHLDRLFKSAELYYMPIPFTLEELRSATHELIRANELRECYIRPIAFRGYGQMGLFPLDAPVEVVVVAKDGGSAGCLVGSLTLEHRCAVVQAVGQYVDLCVLPGDQLSVVPDEVRLLHC